MTVGTTEHAAGRPGAAPRRSPVHRARPSGPAPRPTGAARSIVTPANPRDGSGAGNLRFELGGDLAGIREAAALLLGEDDLVVDRDLEDPAGSFDELGLDAELLLDLFRQTGGARIVVSDGAVLDADLGSHGPISFRREYTGGRQRGSSRGMKWQKILVQEDKSAAGGPNGTRAAKKVAAGLDFGCDYEYNRACSTSLHGTKW